ncbi:VOC family protein [Streptomyces hoynatensis]|uniref:VOC family protein n=1 Tax=Streptomyces hoynatensis TaxID=1141874 RepID=A0A3A9Z3Y8_9ACTN|nr:VOC family protein [Streptomyces hoynatensis]RKN42998.1 VOC family protein [Streptomyces hoynatensis]
MPDFPEGAPCWADVTLPDLEAGKRFYGELFGWTFESASDKYGGYTQAYSEGEPVAALAPQMPGQVDTVPPAWTLYFASPDVRETAARIRDNGGELLMEPMEVGDFGRVLIARDPGGVLFGVWQEGAHHGFGRQGEPGSFCWAEVHTRDPGAADAFYPAVFPIDARGLADPSGLDFKVWSVGGTPVAGRFAIPADAPAEARPHAQVYYAVSDCDAKVAEVQRLGGRLIDGPIDSPYGRLATVADPMGAGFALIDTSTTTGQQPELR